MKKIILNKQVDFGAVDSAIRKSLEEQRFFDEDGNYHITGYATVFGLEDSDGDVIVGEDSFKRIPESIPMKGFHDFNIGTWYDSEFDGVGFKVRGYISKDFPELIARAKNHTLRGLSMGFTASRHLERPEELEDIDVQEVSLVGLGANPQSTLIKASKPSLNLRIVDKPWDSTAAVARIRSVTDSIQEPSDNFRNYFFYYDATEPELFGSYKLPFADVVDGEIVANRQGIISAFGAMQGARGGVNIPEEDRAIVNTSIQSYRDRLGLDKTISIGDFKGLSKSDKKDLLLNKGFSSKLSAALANANIDLKKVDDSSELNKEEIAQAEFDRVIDVWYSRMGRTRPEKSNKQYKEVFSKYQEFVAESTNYDDLLLVATQLGAWLDSLDNNIDDNKEQDKTEGGNGTSSIEPHDNGSENDTKSVDFTACNYTEALQKLALITKPQ